MCGRAEAPRLYIEIQFFLTVEMENGEIRSKFLIGRSSESSAQPPLLGKAKTATGR